MLDCQSVIKILVRITLAKGESYFEYLSKKIEEIVKLKFGHSDYLSAINLQVITPANGTAIGTTF